jgi:hypothetical protein
MMMEKKSGHGNVNEKIDEIVLLEMIEVNEVRSLLNYQNQLMVS